MNDHKNKHIRAAVNYATNYEFTVILANLDEMTTDLANALFAAGCDDGHPWSSEGVAGSRSTAKPTASCPPSVPLSQTCRKRRLRDL